jgi:NAD+ synthase (glutamine-hydrolysing)
MRIALAQQNYHIGHFEGNLQKMLAAVEEARSKGADLVCFPELAVCGYPARDFLEFDDFIQKSYASVEALREASRGIGIVVGSPTRNPLKAGKDLYNSAYFLYDGRVIGRQNKALLPTYDIFDEYRYFEPEKDFHVIEFKGKKVALVVCEDIWNVGNENPLYTVCPLDEMMPEKPDFIINISASPFDYDHAAGRIAVIRANVERYKIPMFYVNHTGAQTDIIFDGGSVVMSADGLVYDEMPYFEEAVGYYDLEDVQKGGRTHPRLFWQIGFQKGHSRAFRRHRLGRNSRFGRQSAGGRQCAGATHAQPVQQRPLGERRAPIGRQPRHPVRHRAHFRHVPGF